MPGTETADVAPSTATSRRAGRTAGADAAPESEPLRARKRTATLRNCPVQSGAQGRSDSAITMAVMKTGSRQRRAERP